jgi:hypothetical protein
MPKLSALAISIGMAFYLSGCGMSTNSVNGTASGILVDDIIIGATVFCDQNNNGMLDAGEPSSVTDQNGQFVFSSTCAAQIVSVAGTGMDKTTQRAPQGSYRALAGSSVISPFTTMQLESGLSTPEFQAVMHTMGLGSQDPATFNPVAQPAQTAMAAAAAAKILNDIAETSVAAGSSGEMAFRESAKTLTQEILKQNQSTTSGSSIFSDTTVISGVIQRTARRGLDHISSWSATQKDNAASIASQGIASSVGVILTKKNMSDAADILRNGAVPTLITQANLSDAQSVSDAVSTVSTAVQAAQYIYVAQDQMLITPTQGSAISATLADFTASGLHLRGQTFSSLASIELPLRSTAFALPEGRTEFALGLTVTDRHSLKKLEVLLDRVQLQRDRADLTRLSIVVPAGAQLHAYARSASGIEVGTEGQGIVNVSADVIQTAAAISLSTSPARLQALLLRQFPAQAQALDSLLNTTGDFDLQIVLGGLMLRQADGTVLPTGTMHVTRSGPTISGPSLAGQLHF